MFTLFLKDSRILLTSVIVFLFNILQLTRLGISNMASEQLKAFLNKMATEPALKKEVLLLATADDVARTALRLGFEFSGDELLRMSGKQVGKVTVIKNDIPGEYY